MASQWPKRGKDKGWKREIFRVLGTEVAFGLEKTSADLADEIVWDRDLGKKDGELANTYAFYRGLEKSLIPVVVKHSNLIPEELRLLELERERRETAGEKS